MGLHILVYWHQFPLFWHNTSLPVRIRSMWRFGDLWNFKIKLDEIKKWGTIKVKFLGWWWGICSHSYHKQQQQTTLILLLSNLTLFFIFMIHILGSFIVWAKQTWTALETQLLHGLLLHICFSVTVWMSQIVFIFKSDLGHIHVWY